MKTQAAEELTMTSEERTNHRRAAKAMAFQARECATTVQALFEHRYEVRFNGPGHTDAETIEHAVDITPELIAQAESILARWQAND